MTSGEVATAPHPKAQPRRIDPPVQRPDLLLVDDHPLMRQGIRDLVVSAGYQVVGEASNMTGAIELARQLRPAMAIVDVTLEDGSGIELIKGRFTDAPTCTHLGCALRWNAAEASWDCSCHGSRFDESGEVLEGPAVRPLDLAGRGDG